jgi:hypothetical protein
MASGGAANAIEAKIDFTLKKDAKGSVQIHWLPDIYFVDMTGSLAAGMWKNRSTVVVRAPKDSFDQWEPLFHEMGQSVLLNPGWIQQELRGQMQRGSTMIRTIQDVGRIGEEIQKGHAETNARINEQAYLFLTDQEDYINPHTHRVERGSNQWDHRWVDDLGNVIYTHDEEYNPNLDLELQMQGFQRSRPKK